MSSLEIKSSLNDFVPPPRITGRYEDTTAGGETVSAFIPIPLPPEPPLVMPSNSHFFLLFSDTNNKLSRMDALVEQLPSIPLFLAPYLEREAVLSSQIEGTQSSLDDLLMGETYSEGESMLDITETSNYLEALNHGIEKLNEGFPLTLRLMCEVHQILMRRGRGSNKQPGEFRRSQNWIGGTRPGNAVFVPPPPQHLMDCMGELEKFIQQENSFNPNLNPMPPLLRAALAHLQFETIHPFLDGNGRLGRMLISLILYDAKILHQPCLYLSLFFKQNRDEYYRLLNRVRLDGNWELWVEFFLTGVAHTAQHGTDLAHKLLKIVAIDEARIRSSVGSNRNVLRLHQYLQSRPLVSVTRASKEIGISFPTASKAFEKLVSLGLVRERTGKLRDRFFEYTDYFALLAEDTEPLPR
ncbi:MAG: Fic family protein [Candidatus Pacebacteria bacterium]|nr:Fic family protein [Candidatus Paceibacterota bacterium]